MDLNNRQCVRFAAYDVANKRYQSRRSCPGQRLAAVSAATFILLCTIVSGPVLAQEQTKRKSAGGLSRLVGKLFGKGGQTREEPDTAREEPDTASQAASRQAGAGAQTVSTPMTSRPTAPTGRDTIHATTSQSVPSQSAEWGLAKTSTSRRQSQRATALAASTRKNLSADPRGSSYPARVHAIPVATTRDFTAFRTQDVLSELQQTGSSVLPAGEPSYEHWWDEHVQTGSRGIQEIPADIDQLLTIALKNSNNIKIALRDPLIRATAIQKADSNFDWVPYLNTAWNDTSEPVGNELIAGGTTRRFNDHVWTGSGGVRRQNRYGGLFDLSQRFGWQDNNSQFFTPRDQATSQIIMSYTQPLMRGRGVCYNTSLVLLARLDHQSAHQSFLAGLQDELLEIVRGYWALYRERAVLAQKIRLYLRTKDIYETLHARQFVDTQQTQLVIAASAVQNRRAELIRANTAVTNAETRLRGLLNAPEFDNADVAEIIPTEIPTLNYVPASVADEIHVALQMRPEIHAAIQEVKSGATRLNIAKHELLPVLNLVTSVYANGLRGDSQFAGAYGDQFSEGAPSYTIGLQYELPWGNRAAKAEVCRRHHEFEQLKSQYARALQSVQTEVDIAVREVQTAYRESLAKQRAMVAAREQAASIEQRWLRMADGSGTSALNLESLLEAEESLTRSEEDYIATLLTYNLSILNLKRANGTLLQAENVLVGSSRECGCGMLVLDKAQSCEIAYEANSAPPATMEMITPSPSPTLNSNPVPNSNPVTSSATDSGAQRTAMRSSVSNVSAPRKTQSSTPALLSSSESLSELPKPSFRLPFDPAEMSAIGTTDQVQRNVYRPLEVSSRRQGSSRRMTR